MKNTKELLLEGQGTFCDLIKMALYQEDETIFERLDFENDALYMEPMLFGYCTQKEQDPIKDQLLFGTYTAVERPAQFRVQSNQRGIVYLPSYAYLHTNLPSTDMMVHYNVEQDKILLEKDGIPVAYKLEALRYLKQLPEVELTSCIDVYSEQLFYSWPKVEQGAINDLLNGEGVMLDAFQPAIEKALLLLQTYFPEEFELYRLTTRKIILFALPELRNFATRQAHGTIYLNVTAQSNTTFFLEELIHQCSHTVFNAVTCETQAFFKVDYNKTVGELLGNSDYRTLYSALHGIYTTGQLVHLFLQLLKADLNWSPRLVHELQGRLAINKMRHNIGLEKVDAEEVFTPQGRAIFEHYYQQLDQNIRNNASFFDYDMSRHPVVFDYAKFRADNPL